MVAQLTHELLAKIFSHLDPVILLQLRLVCRLFRDVLESHIHHFDFSGSDINLSEQLRICCLFSGLDEITIAEPCHAESLPQSEDKLSQALQCALQKRYTLRYLRMCVTAQHITDGDVFFITRNCRHLLSIYLSNCRVTDIAMLHLSSCHQLREITICGSSALTDVALIHISQQCHLLQYAVFGTFTIVTDDGLGYFARGCTDIRTLLLIVKEHRITHVGISKLRSMCLKLQTLDIQREFQTIDTSAPFVGDEADKTLLKSLQAHTG